MLSSDCRGLTQTGALNSPVDRDAPYKQNETNGEGGHTEFSDSPSSSGFMLLVI